MKQSSRIAIFLLVILSSVSFGAEDKSEEGVGVKIKSGFETVKKKSSEFADNIGKELEKNKKRRSKKNWGTHFNYTYLDTWIPGKIGLNLYYIESQKVTWDLEYLKGSLSVPSFIFDLGEFSDTRVSFLKRSYGRKTSFHYFYGAYYNHINIQLGDDMLSSVSGGNKSSVDVMSIKLLGATWGFGNRWHTSGKFTWGVDWFTVNLPLVVLESETPYLEKSNEKDDRDDARGAIGVMESYPTFSILKLQLGISW